MNSEVATNIVGQDAFEACKEANILAKRIFQRISNQENINLKVKTLEIKDILDFNTNKLAFVYTGDKMKKVDIRGNVENSLIKTIKSDKNYQIDVQACMEVFPHVSRHGNPGSLKDGFEQVKDEICLLFKNSNEKEIFVSDPIIRFNSIFFFIIELDKDFYDKYVILPPVQEHHGMWLTSFVNQIIDILFDYWRESLHLQLKYSTTSVDMSEDEIIRLAAQDMTQGRSLPHPNIFSKISVQNYEGRACKGKMAFIENEIKIDEYIEFEESIEISEKNIRHIRKLLEMTGGEYCLYASNDNIQGFGRITKELDIQSIEFLGYAKWRLLFSNKEVLRAHNGEIILPKSNFDKLNCVEIIEQFFINSKSKKDFDFLGVLIEKATEQRHGTMILISDEAKEEAQRLCGNGRGTKIVPLSLKEDAIEKLSSIDGALMIDLNGICHGIGIIVDGISQANGNPERGARFNSAKNYVNYRNKNKNKCVAIVVSEDKSVDVIVR